SDENWESSCGKFLIAPLASIPNSLFFYPRFGDRSLISEAQEISDLSPNFPMRRARLGSIQQVYLCAWTKHNALNRYRKRYCRTNSTGGCFTVFGEAIPSAKIFSGWITQNLRRGGGSTLFQRRGRLRKLFTRSRRELSIACRETSKFICHGSSFTSIYVMCSPACGKSRCSTRR